MIQKNIFIGDIHGNYDMFCYLRETFSAEDTRLIFVGDYTDARGNFGDRGITAQRKIISEIIEDSNPNHIYLRGNHDWGYIAPGKMASSMTDPDIMDEIEGIIGSKSFMERTLDIYRVPDTNIVVSHAGIHSAALRKIGVTDVSSLDIDELMEIVRADIDQGQKTIFDFERTVSLLTLSDGIIWGRRKLKSDKLNGIVQVVGHTPVRIIADYKYVKYIDTLNYGDRSILEYDHVSKKFDILKSDYA